jgi:hypothetical protein
MLFVDIHDYYVNYYARVDRLSIAFLFKLYLSVFTGRKLKDTAGFTATN